MCEGMWGVCGSVGVGVCKGVCVGCVRGCVGCVRGCVGCYVLTIKIGSYQNTNILLVSRIDN